MDEVVRHHTDWIFITGIVMGSILVYVRWVYPKRFAQLSSLRRQMVMPLDPSYERSKTGLLELLLTVNYVMCLSFVMLKGYYYLKNIPPQATDVYLFLQLLLAVGLYLVLRNLLIRITAQLFQVLKFSDWWIERLHYYRIGVGIWMPIMLIIAFFGGILSPFVLVLALTYQVIFLLRMMLSSGKVLVTQGGIGVMRIVLYLCALEIAPLIWLLFWIFG